MAKAAIDHFLGFQLFYENTSLTLTLLQSLSLIKSSIKLSM